MDFIVDSGLGGSHINQYLEILGVDRIPKLIKIGYPIGNLNKSDIKPIFRELEKKYGLSPNNTYIGCCSLNSIFRGYNGSYNLLIDYLEKKEIKRGNRNIGVYCTHITSKSLRKYDIDIIPLKNTALDIEKGKKPKIKSPNYDKIILGCTHYDKIHFEGIKNITSVSFLSALELKKIINEVD